MISDLLSFAGQTGAYGSFSAAILIGLLSVFLLSLRYALLLRRMKERMSVKDAFSINMISSFANYLSPFRAGSIITMPAASRAISGVPVRKAFTAMAFSQAFDLAWEIMLLPVMAIMIGRKDVLLSSGWILAAGLVIAWAFLVLFRNKAKSVIMSVVAWSLDRVPERLRAFAGRKLGVSRNDLKSAVAEAGEMASDPVLLAEMALPTIVLIVTFPLVVTFCSSAFGFTVSYSTAFVSYWASYVVGRISGLPAGIGTKDLMMAGLLGASGVPAAAALKIVIAYRAASLLPLVAVGGPMSVYYGGKIGVKTVLKTEGKKHARKD